MESRATVRGMRTRIALARIALVLVISVGAAARAAEQTLTLDPAASEIDFELGATLHSADGSVKLEQGTIRFDADSGAASGEIVVDATSANTGSGSRDRNMHADVLESGRFPKIVFRPERLDVKRRDAASADVVLLGALDMHGQQHPLSLPAKLALRDGRLVVDAKFEVPYVEWGMRDYSNFVLRVDRHVTVTVHAEGALATH
jgi:polyisoprenoid-binding protein YceI